MERRLEVVSRASPCKLILKWVLLTFRFVDERGNA